MIRLFDILSTYLCMNKYQGWEYIEGIPFSASLIKLGYFNFVVINLLISLFIYWLLNKWYLGKFILQIFIMLNTLVVISNFICFIFI